MLQHSPDGVIIKTVKILKTYLIKAYIPKKGRVV